MNLRAHTRIPFPRDLVFRTIRDKLPELAPYMPNVRSIEMKERTDEGARTRFVNVWVAKSEIPAAAQRYIKAEQLSWIDRALWNEEGFCCDWSIETQAFPGVVECQGRNTYTSVGNETELQIDGTLTLHLDKLSIPRLLAVTVRPLIEGIVVTALKPNLLSIGEGVAAYLKSRSAA